jgi:hypothetical protein
MRRITGHSHKSAQNQLRRDTTRWAPQRTPGKTSVSSACLLGSLVSGNYALVALHEPERPTEANRKATRTAHAKLQEPPLRVPQDISGTNDKVVHPGPNCIEIGR